MTNTFLEPSPFATDGGEFVGKDPRKIPRAVLRTLGTSETPVKAIRGKCLDCSAGNDAEIRKCPSYRCALWPYRMGVNVFHARSNNNTTEEVSR